MKLFVLLGFATFAMLISTGHASQQGQGWDRKRAKNSIERFDNSSEKYISRHQRENEAALKQQKRLDTDRSGKALNVKLEQELKAREPSIEDAEYYIKHSVIAYCEYSTIETMTCGRCQQLLPDVKFVKIVVDDKNRTETMVLITVNDKRKEIVIAYRGTVNIENVLLDFNMVLKDEKPGPQGVKVHRGFQKGVHVLHDQVVTEVKKQLEDNLRKNYDIKVVGHSLGGSLAILAVYRFKVLNSFPESNKMALFTYGQPRTGNKAFANFINSLDMPIVRVTHQSDLFVHLVPVGLGYVHTQHELFIDDKHKPRYCNNTVYEDPTCSNAYGKDRKYDPVDHIFYFGEDTSTCIEESPISFIMQFVLPFKRVIKVIAPGLDIEGILKPARKIFDFVSPVFIKPVAKTVKFVSELKLHEQH